VGIKSGEAKREDVKRDTTWARLLAYAAAQFAR